MRTVVVVAAVTALMMGVLSAFPTSEFADELVMLTGGAKQVNFDGTNAQIIPTDKGILLVLGRTVKGQPANVLLFEGARLAQIKVTPHTHTQVITIHRELDEQLKAEIEKDAKNQGD